MRLPWRAQLTAETWFVLAVAIWLWFTVVFANFAEAMAEGRGKAQYCELKQRWEAPLVPGEEMGPADQPFGQNPQSVALAQRVRAVADGAS